MRRKKLTMMVALLTCALACLISASVCAGEHPWDADHGGDGSTGIPGPITPSPDPGTSGIVSVARPGGQPGADLRSVFLVTVSYYAARYFMPGQTTIQTPKRTILKKEMAR